MSIGAALVVITVLLLLVFHPGFRKIALIGAGAAIGIGALIVGGIYAVSYISEAWEKSRVAALQEKVAALQEKVDAYNGCHAKLRDDAKDDADIAKLARDISRPFSEVDDWDPDPTPPTAGAYRTAPKAKWPFRYPPCNGRVVTGANYTDVPPAVIPRWQQEEAAQEKEAQTQRDIRDCVAAAGNSEDQQRKCYY